MPRTYPSSPLQLKLKHWTLLFGFLFVLWLVVWLPSGTAASYPTFQQENFSELAILLIPPDLRGTSETRPESLGPGTASLQPPGLDSKAYIVTNETGSSLPGHTPLDPSLRKLGRYMRSIVNTPRLPKYTLICFDHVYFDDTFRPTLRAIEKSFARTKSLFLTGRLRHHYRKGQRVGHSHGWNSTNSTFYVDDNQHYVLFSSSLFHSSSFPYDLDISDPFAGNQLMDWAVRQKDTLDIATVDCTDTLVALHLNKQRLHDLRTSVHHKRQYRPQRVWKGRNALGPLITLTSRAEYSTRVGDRGQIDIRQTRDDWPSPLVLEELHSQGTLIAASPNCAFLDMAVNWLVNLQRLGVNNIVLFPKDMKAFRYLETMFPGHSVWNPEFNLVSSFDSTEFGTKGFKSLVRQRPMSIKSILRRNLNVYWSDTDIVYRENPLAYIPEHQDAVFQHDHLVDICTCMLYFKSSPHTLKLMDDWFARMESSRDDQQAFQTVGYAFHHRKDVQTTFLPNNLFPDGRSLFKENQFPIEEAVAVHNNWIVGHDNKVERFRKYNLWDKEAELNIDSICS